MYILAALSFMLKHIGKCGKMKIVTQQKFLKGKADKMRLTVYNSTRLKMKRD